MNELRDALMGVLAKHSALSFDRALQIVGMVENALAARPIDVDALGHKLHERFTITAERLADILGEMKELHATHWEETEEYRHEQGLNPNYASMIASEAAGRYILFTVRDNSGLLVGNCALYLHRSLHTGKLVATEDTLFLKKECRGRGLAQALIRFAEDSLRSLGVAEVRVSSKTVNGADKFMRRLKYKHTANQLSKAL